MDVRSWRGRFIFFLFFVIAYYGTYIVRLVIHEVLGHGLFALSFGGVVSAIYLNPVSASYAFFGVHHDVAVSSFQSGLIYAGGMIMEAVVGIAVILLYRRLRGLTSRFFALLVVFQLLFQNALYLGRGAVGGLLGLVPSGVDPVGIHHFLGVSYEMMIVLGLIMAIPSMYFVLQQFLLLFHEYFAFLGRKEVLLFFVLLILIRQGMFFLISMLLEPSPIELLSLVPYAVELLFVGVVGLLVTMRTHLPASVAMKALRLPRRLVSVFSVLAILVTAIWIGLFGVTYTGAHGILLYEYPVYCNVQIHVFRDQSAVVDLSYRPPLDHAWAQIKAQDNWSIYLEVASASIKRMFSITTYDVLRTEITDDHFWKDEAWHSGGARRIQIGVNLVTSPQWQQHDDEFTLTIRDPWQLPYFLNAVNITSTGLSLSDYYCMPSTNQVTEGGPHQGYLLWLNSRFRANPEIYHITFKIAS